MESRQNNEHAVKHDNSLAGKRAFIGGASKGIGKAIAELLAARGATVCLLARTQETLESVVRGLDTSQGQTHSFIVGSVDNPSPIIHNVEEQLKNFGPFHIVINNTAGPVGGKLVDSDINQLLDAFGNHIVFSHQLMRAVINSMKVIHYGRFINIISTSVKQPLEGLGVSNTIRGAMASWSKTLATEVAAYGITVNNVLPGATETERLESIIAKKAATLGASEQAVREEMASEIPVGRFAQPVEIARAVGFLASDEASYITGTSILVDGGRTRTLT